MITVYEGQPTAAEGRFAIIVARFNQSITGRMLDGAVQTLIAHGVPDDRIDVAWVPGAFEIPTAAARLAAAGRYAAILCLGAVIRGQTTHDQHINRAVSIALAQLGVQYKMPVIFGILTCETLEQAIARSGGQAAATGCPLAEHASKNEVGGADDAQAHVGNKGVDCALSALEMVNLLEKLPKA